MAPKQIANKKKVEKNPKGGNGKKKKGHGKGDGDPNGNDLGPGK